MKQFLLLVLTAVLSLSAGAQTRTFTDQLVIELGGKSGATAPINAQVLLTEHDGKVDLELRNFVFKTPTVNTAVGHIKLSDLTVTEDGDKKRFSGKGKPNLRAAICRAISFGCPRSCLRSIWRPMAISQPTA